MSARKVVDFLILRSAFTQRNVTSILLVGLFFGVFILAGGKITTVPPKSLKSGNTFGGVATRDGENESAEQQPPQMDGAGMEKAKPEEILGIDENPDLAAREKVQQKKGSRFDPSSGDEDPAEEELSEAGLVDGVDMTNHREEFMLKRNEKRKEDTLAHIEERLNIKRRDKAKFAKEE